MFKKKPLNQIRIHADPLSFSKTITLLKVQKLSASLDVVIALKKSQWRPDLLLPSGPGFHHVNTFGVSIIERGVVSVIIELEVLRQEMAYLGRRPAWSSGQEVVS